MGKAPGFFDFDDRLKRLRDLGDQLEAFGRTVDFEMFRPDLVAALAYSPGERGGRPPFDPVMMFKVLVIQTTNNLVGGRKVECSIVEKMVKPLSRPEGDAAKWTAYPGHHQTGLQSSTQQCHGFSYHRYDGAWSASMSQIDNGKLAKPPFGYTARMGECSLTSEKLCVLARNSSKIISNSRRASGAPGQMCIPAPYSRFPFWFRSIRM